jgi:Predicted redox protein, regulator of disulfide bond formation
MKTTSFWKKDHEFESHLGQHSITLDGHRKVGFNPKALLLSSLAACSGIDVVDILEKMRLQFSDFEIEVEADQTEEHPRVFKDILITYKIKTEKQNEEKVKKAIELSIDKYCGVAAMLRKNSSVNYTLQIK